VLREVRVAGHADAAEPAEGWCLTTNANPSGQLAARRIRIGAASLQAQSPPLLFA
jgi:hypothetical protein